MRNTYGYKRVPEPGAFLISVIDGGQYRWGNYLMNFIKASNDMLGSIK